MFGQTVLKPLVIEAKRAQEEFHSSQDSTEADPLSKTQIQQICFDRLIQFMSHPDILGKPIMDRQEPIPISWYPNQNDLIDMKKGNDILKVLERIMSPLFLDLKFNLMDKEVKDSFKLLFIPEIFQLSELHKSICDKLKKMCCLYSEYLIQNIITAIVKNVTLDSEERIDPVFVEAVKKHEALPYKTAHLSVEPNLQLKLYLRIKNPISALSEEITNYYYITHLNIAVLQFLFDHKIIYFHEPRYSFLDYDSFGSPIMEAAKHGNVKLFELMSRALPPHNNYVYNFYGATEINAWEDKCRSPLMVAARSNRLDIVKIILDDENTVAETLVKSDWGRWTALMHAGCSGNVEVVELMIQKASSLGLTSTLVNFCGRINHTAFTIAAYSGQLEVVKILMPHVEQRTKVEDNTPQSEQYINQFEVALSLAKKNRHIAVVGYLRTLLQEEKSSAPQCRLM